MDNPAPSLPPEMPTADQVTWPRVLGIICIVFGAGAAIVTVVSTIGQKTMAKFSQRQMEMTGVDPAAYEALMEQYSGKLMAAGVATGLVALLLALGGVLLLLRKRKSSTALKTWAGLKIALVLITIPLNASFQKANTELAFSGALAGEGAELAAAGARIGLVVGIAFGVLWGGALPAFILVWFSRKKIKEQVAFWD